MDNVLLRGERARTERREFFRPAIHFGGEFGGRHNRVDQTAPLGFGRVPVAPGEGQFARVHDADGLRENCRLDDGRDAALDVGQAELRTVGGDQQVARKRQLESRAEAQPVNLGDDGFLQRADRAEGCVQFLPDSPRPPGVQVFHVGHVNPGAEGALAGGIKDDDPNRIVVGDPGQRRANLVEHRAVDGVERPRPVKGEAGDGVVPLEGERGKFHRDLRKRQ